MAKGWSFSKIYDAIENSVELFVFFALPTVGLWWLIYEQLHYGCAHVYVVTSPGHYDRCLPLWLNPDFYAACSIWALFLFVGIVVFKNRRRRGQGQKAK